MLILLSPAKDLNESPVSGIRTSEPVLLEHAVPLAEKLRGMSAKRLATLMDISPKLATLNHARYQVWSVPLGKHALPAGFAFNGEAYRGLDIRTLGGDDLRFAQRHLRILSGLYGVLRPLDRMLPYRLEMGTALAMGRGLKDLYAWWGDRITNALEGDLKQAGKVVVNLASQEYFKAVRTERLGVPVITPVFKDRAGSGYKVVMVFAKHQRGAMARHIIRHRIIDPQQLKKYDGDGYRFSAEESTADQWVFLRDRR